jgi:diguanylate cyclase (GGDEF)-like protein/PAS domain S-box-containing protein
MPPDGSDSHTQGGAIEGSEDQSALTAVTASTEVELFSVAGTDGIVREVNESFAQLLGLPMADIAGRSLLELVHPDDIVDLATGLGALEQGAAEVLFESRFVQHGGGWVHLQWVARSMPGTTLWWACGRDTTAFHRLVAEKLGLRAQLDLAVGSATAAMWNYDFHHQTFDWEPQAAQVLGLSADSVPVTVPELTAASHPEDTAAILLAFDRFATGGRLEVGLRVGHDGELRHLSLRGKVLERDRRGRAVRAAGLILDVTAERAMEEQMLRMIMADALTGIPNRRAFDQSLRAEWRRSKRSGEPLSVVMIDIDDFKSFNDSYGHRVGDEALCAVARCLTDTVHREGDVVARFGGEEFAAVLPATSHDDAMLLTEKMLHAVRQIVLRQAQGGSLTVSIGTATWSPSASTGDAKISSETLLARAGQAVDTAKAAGKDRVASYELSIAPADTFLAAISGGLPNDEFVLYYQPVIRLDTGALHGFEALIRWNRPGAGLVSPDDFIPQAEASSLICDLGRWALTEAACQLAAWARDGVDGGEQLTMAVNASGRHIGSPQIVADIASALATSGIPAHQLDVELTETALIKHEVADRQLAAVRALGVRVSLDDFGTGYTSVSQLPHLPVDILKIDRSFVSATDPRQRALVALMVEAAHAFDLTVVAEGVEDVGTFQQLRSLGCDLAQGYLMGRPMPSAEIPAWVAAWNERAAGALLTRVPGPRTDEPAPQAVSAAAARPA